jgi:hypothetical protein
LARKKVQTFTVAGADDEEVGTISGPKDSE